MIDGVAAAACQSHLRALAYPSEAAVLAADDVQSLGRISASRPLTTEWEGRNKLHRSRLPVDAVPFGASPQMEARWMQVERILREYGQFLRPMAEAPRGGQRILGRSAQSGRLISCYWEPHPAGLIGPNWVEERDSLVGYVDRFFDGWIQLSDFRLLDANAINRLLVAYIDDARAVDDREALSVLEMTSDRRGDEAG